MRLFGRLCRGGLAGHQFLPALVDLQPLREDGAGLCSVGIGLLHGHFGAQHGGLRPRYLRLLLGGVEPGEHLPFRHHVTVIGVELGDRSADLEADAR